MSWRVSGSYFESCNCNPICPCRRIDGVPGGRSTHGECVGVLSWVIDRGHAEDLSLDGLAVALATRYHDDEPGSPWSFVVYLDERADDAQREALEAIYTGGHDATLLAVANGKVDAGALDEAVFQRLTTTGKVDPAKVRVFWTTPPFFDYVWVARKGLDAKLSAAVSNAFLALSDADPQQKQILDALSAKKYLPAEDASYDKLRQAAEQAGLLQ